jgi:hypothetical protein
MSSIKDAAIGFEAVKVSMSQDKNGIMLRLNVHPNDCPQELHTDWVGTRYMVAMVRLNDQDEPEPREEAVNVERLIASAGLLCRNDDFHDYLYSMGMTEKTDVFNQEKEAVSAVRTHCGIKSRSEFRDNPDAINKFEELREGFKEWKKN